MSTNIQKNNMKYFLAIDIGASSGRHIVGYLKENEIVLDKVYSFPTGMDETEDGFVWDIKRIFEEIKFGIKKSFEKYKNIQSIAIDTFGVDYVLMDNDKEIPPFYTYRNTRNISASEQLHKILSFEELYSKTGIQYAPYNTIYQFYDDLKKGRLEKATDYLMLPTYFSYKLTGVKTHEFTIESTGALIDPHTGEYNKEILDKIGFPKKLFKKIEKPGYVLGNLLPSIAEEVGGNAKVVLCASHDTASAFEAVNCNDDSIILSSGTWSLFGVKLSKPICTEESLKANFTNEGGVNYTRFLKNIIGMWIVNKLYKEDGIDYLEIIPRLPSNDYTELFDVNDVSLVAPKNMKKAILKLLKNNPPRNDEDLLNAVYHSLAYAYKNACDDLELITKKKYKTIYIVGGGSKNQYLNSLVEKYTNKKVATIETEATSIGNIKVQMEKVEKL